MEKNDCTTSVRKGMGSNVKARGKLKKGVLLHAAACSPFSFSSHMVLPTSSPVTIN
jgi:hypothetical protein